MKAERSRRELHHVEIHGHEDSSPDEPKYIVIHFYDKGSREHEIDGHDALMEHLHSATHPDTLMAYEYEDEEKDGEQRN